MGFDLRIFGDEQLEADYIEWLVDERSVDIQSRLMKLWEYYANPMQEARSVAGSERGTNTSGRCYVQAQEYGLPPRITGLVHSGNVGTFGGQRVRDVQRKEVVIENDIAWRVNAGVEFLFGRPITFVSRSPDSQKRAKIESVLKTVFAANGGIEFFQNMAVLGSVYGFVDCLVRPGDDILEDILGTHKTLSFEDVLQLARTIGLELVEAPRALPVLEEDDYKKIRYYV